MTVYVVGHNMAGYLPEVELWATEDFDAARASLVEEITRHVEGLMDGGTPDEDLLGYAGAILELEAMTEPGEFGTQIGYYSFWLSIGTEEDLVNVEW